MTRLEKLHRLKRKIETEIHRIEKTSASCDEIVKYACEWFKVGYYKLLSPSRKIGLVDIRCIITHELRNRGSTLSDIGNSLDRSHETIFNLEKRYLDRMQAPGEESFKKHARQFAEDLNEWEEMIWHEKKIERTSLRVQRKTFI